MDLERLVCIKKPYDVKQLLSQIGKVLASKNSPKTKTNASDGNMLSQKGQELLKELQTLSQKNDESLSKTILSFLKSSEASWYFDSSDSLLLLKMAEQLETEAGEKKSATENASLLADSGKTISIICSCGEKYYANEKQAGKWIKCQKCGSLIEVNLPRVSPKSATNPSLTEPVRTYTERRIHNWSTLPNSNRVALLWCAAILLIAFISSITKHVGQEPSHTSPPVINTLPATPPEYSRDNRYSNSGNGLDQDIPLHYAIGSIDPQFGIAKSRIVEIAGEAEQIWEKPFGCKIFVYDPNARLKINLIFDERQRKTLEAKRLKETIERGDKSYNTLVAEYDAEAEEKGEFARRYELDEATFNDRLNQYNSNVNYWNNNGGAPDDEILTLDREKSEIELERSNLETELLVLNSKVDNLNNLAATINDLAREHNWDVSIFNGRYVEGRKFDAGIYDGMEINIYQFDDEASLRLTLAHELGHALGFEHTTDPTSLMYPELQKQDISNFHLTTADSKLMKRKLRI